MSERTRTVAILVFDDVEVLDFAGPFEVFNVAGETIGGPGRPAFATSLVGETGEAVTARGRMRVTPHHAMEAAPEPDILIVPGGLGTRRLLTNERVLGWIARQAARAPILASVCTGSLVLAKLGLLGGLRATTHHQSLDRLARLDPSIAVVRDQRFVRNEVDGRVIVTAGGISAGIDMSLALVRALHGEAVERVMAEMEWGWFPAGGDAPA